MKLSEAIRAGAKIRPQAFGNLYQDQHRFSWRCLVGKCKTERMSCALGAAFEAGGVGSHTETAQELSKAFRGNVEQGAQVRIFETPYEWTLLLSSNADCPQCGQNDVVKALITHLNDAHKWKREEIALFVERLEQSLERQRAAQQPVVVSPTKPEEWPAVIGTDS